MLDLPSSGNLILDWRRADCFRGFMIPHHTAQVICSHWSQIALFALCLRMETHSVNSASWSQCMLFAVNIPAGSSTSPPGAKMSALSDSHPLALCFHMLRSTQVTWSGGCEGLRLAIGSGMHKLVYSPGHVTEVGPLQGVWTSQAALGSL